MGCLPLILLGVGVAIASYIAWISLQSLLQARALFRLARASSTEPDDYGRQALYGRVRVERVVQKGFGDLLWCRTEEQVYRKRGKNSGWKTEHTEDEMAAFTLEGGGQEISLAELPSEVQGTRSRTQLHDPGGFFGHSNGDRRTVYTYLAVPRYVSVAGRRVDAGRLGRDNKLGLFLSPHEPGHAATIELWKGIGGLLVVTAALAFGLFVYAQKR